MREKKNTDIGPFPYPSNPNPPKILAPSATCDGTPGAGREIGREEQGRVRKGRERLGEGKSREKEGKRGEGREKVRGEGGEQRRRNGVKRD